MTYMPDGKEYVHITTIVKYMTMLHDIENNTDLYTEEINLKSITDDYTIFCNVEGLQYYKPFFDKCNALIDRTRLHNEEKQRKVEEYRIKTLEAENKLRDTIIRILTKPKYTTLDESESFSEYILHLKFGNLPIMPHKCDYSGSTENLFLVNCPCGNELYVVCTKQYINRAIEDVKKYCRENLIFPQHNLDNFMMKKGCNFLYAKIYDDFIEPITLLQLAGGCDDLCFTRKCSNKKTIIEICCKSKYCKKYINLDEICELNYIDDTLKQEIVSFLNEELETYFS